MSATKRGWGGVSPCVEEATAEAMGKVEDAPTRAFSTTAFNCLSDSGGSARNGRSRRTGEVLLGERSGDVERKRRTTTGGAPFQTRTLLGWPLGLSPETSPSGGLLRERTDLLRQGRTSRDVERRRSRGSQLRRQGQPGDFGGVRRVRPEKDSMLAVLLLIVRPAPSFTRARALLRPAHRRLPDRSFAGLSSQPTQELLEFPRQLAPPALSPSPAPPSQPAPCFSLAMAFPHQKPRSRTGIRLQIWRWRALIESTFGLGMMDPWEVVIICASLPRV